VRPPPLRARMARRLLVNYRVDPQVLAGVLPAPFRPALVAGQGVAGLCLLRLGGVRPAGLPAAVGVRSENAAHRVAVCWDTPDGAVTGVYVPRRDTSSRLAALVGGRAFPGWQHLARFDVREADGRYRIQVGSRDGAVRIRICARSADTVMPGSVFADLAAASRFFRRAPLGYAATPTEGVFDGVELSTDSWALTPAHVDEAHSSFFDDPQRFPPGTIALDSAFLMGGLDTSWHPQPGLRATPAGRSTEAPNPTSPAAPR
jgi:hypothetical protein